MSESISKQIMELYCDSGILTNEFYIDTTPKTILKELTKTNTKYTWETVRDERIDNIQSVIEVRVYLPGHILYGRHIYKTADASDAHLYAISDAIKIIVHEKENPEVIKEEKSQPVPMPTPVSTPQPQIESKQQTQALSQEEILGMIQQADTKITTAEQLNNDPREEIPFEEVALSPDELDNLFQSNNQQQVPQQVHSNTSFTEAQINAVRQIKAKFNITEEERFSSLINAWNKKYTSKKDLTPENVDSFIKWANDLGKCPC